MCDEIDRLTAENEAIKTAIGQQVDRNRRLRNQVRNRGRKLREALAEIDRLRAGVVAHDAARAVLVDEVNRLRAQVASQVAAATHDPTGHDHFEDAVRLAAENDELRRWQQEACDRVYDLAARLGALSESGVLDLLGRAGKEVQ